METRMRVGSRYYPLFRDRQLWLHWNFFSKLFPQVVGVDACLSVRSITTSSVCLIMAQNQILEQDTG
jgi:hypothetical protein